MADLSLDSLTAPLPGDEPCGPDLDLAYDEEYTNFMAYAEGLLPVTFYSPVDGHPFDRATVDFASQYKVIAHLGERTRDLRLLVLLAKFRILDRDVVGFATAVEAIATLLERHWEAVHPRGDNGDFGFRAAVVQSLDDRVPVVLPLTYAPLLEHRAVGALTYRKHLVAEGEVEPREDEEKVDLAVVRRDLEEKRLSPPVERRDQIKAISAALGRIKAIFADRTGRAQAVEFSNLQPLVEQIRAMLDAFVVLADPTKGDTAQKEGVPEDEEPEIPLVAGDIACLADARAALEAIAAYYERREPSSPALLLVRQAIQLVGKSFIDALRVLVPSYVEDVKVQIGKVQVFDLPIERLSEFAAIESTGEDSPADPATFEVTSRDSALQLLKKVGAFYHGAEPSSPVPYLVERARELAPRDFLGLLREMLPRDTLRTPEGK
jgi:type VI secretion system protein ImpA